MADSTLDGFSLFFGIAEGVGIILIIMMGVWLGYYRGGFAWTSNPALEFNWHPLLLFIGLIFMYANSMMVYRSFRNMPKKKLKLAHTILHAVAFVLTVIGLQAVFDSHNLSAKPMPNMYSLHSWVGLSAVIMFTCQLVAGFITFMFPTLSGPLRASYLPVHVFFGISGFGLAVVSAMLGLCEKAIFSLPNYKDLPGEAVLVNLIGVGILAFAIIVAYITVEPRYKRQPIPEDEMLLAPSSPQTSSTAVRETASAAAVDSTL